MNVRGRNITGFVLMIACLTLVLAVSSAQDESSGGYVAFVSQDEDNTDIFIADLTTGAVRNVSNNTVQSAHPSWSGDGSQLTFNNVLTDGNIEIFVMEANGLGQRNVSNHPAVDVSPDWSPVSNEIAFMSNRDGGFDLYAVDINTGETRRLTSDGQQKNRPDWSPDGTQIAYWQIEGDAVALKLLDVDSGAITTLVDSGQNLWPDWSPDGTQIAVHSEETGSAQIYVVDVETGERTQITDDGFTNYRPTWSPDGAQIMYISIRGEGEAANGDLYSVDVAGGEPQPFLESPANDISPVWRDGQPPIDFAANPLLGQNASMRVNQASVTGDQQAELGEGRYRLFAPAQAGLDDVIRIRLEIELLQVDSVPETDVPLQEEGELTVFRYMGAQLTGLDLDLFDVYPAPTGYLLQIQEDDANYWEWILRPKNEAALGERFFIVEIYLPDISDDGIVTKDIQRTIFFDVDIVSGEPQNPPAPPPDDPAETVQILNSAEFIQRTLLPEPTEGISVYHNNENLLAIRFSREVDVSQMRVASGNADYALVDVFPDIDLAFNGVLPADYCISYERAGNTDVPLPLACALDRSLQRPLNPGNVFWFDASGGSLQDVIIRFRGKALVCSPRFERCDF